LRAALSIGTARRSADIPNVPVFSEAGYPEFQFTAQYGAFCACQDTQRRGGQTLQWLGGVAPAPRRHHLLDQNRQHQGRHLRVVLAPRTNLQVGDGCCMSNNNSAQRLNRECPYPSLVQAADGALHAAYSVFRQHIRHLRLTPECMVSAEA
jgi:hypothetical protein